MFRGILLGIDDSESGHLAVSFASAVASDGSAAVRVLYVNKFIGRGHKLLLPKDAKALVHDAVRQLRAGGVDATGAVAAAPSQGVGLRVADAALDFQADVIILGSRRRRGIARLGAGGMREQVTRSTWLPVLIAPSPLRKISRPRAAKPDTVDVGSTPQIR